MTALITPTGVSQASLTSQLAALVATIPPTAFVDLTTRTVEEIHTLYPPGATYLGKYARVSDLYNAVDSGLDEILRCGASMVSGVLTYYWRPQRDDFATSISTTGGTIPALVSLVSPPTIYIGGTLVGAATLAMPTTRTWPGQSYRVVSTGTLGIFGINLTGLLTSPVPLLTGADRIITYVGGASPGWRAA